MVLLKNKENNEKTLRPRSGTYVLQRKKPTEIPRSVTTAPIVVTKPIEEWKRPGEDVVLTPPEEIEKEKIQTPRRRLWSTNMMKGLREDLANNGSIESVIQMGSELLDGLSKESTDPEEIAYREEQALFWYEKAAERGSSEAKDLIMQMVLRKSSGINSSNVASLGEVLNLSEEELAGKRIGHLLFHSLVQVDSDIIFAEGLVGQSCGARLHSDCLTSSELILCGKEYMKGRVVPEVDTKIIHAENSCSSSLSLLLNNYILFFYLLQNIILTLVFKNILFYLTLLTLIYHYWMFVSHVCLIQGAVILMFLSSSISLLHKPLKKKRFDVWSRIWQRLPSSKSGISKKEAMSALYAFNTAYNVHFVLVTSLSLAMAENIFGLEHPLTVTLTSSIVPLLFLFQSRLATILTYACILCASYSGMSIIPEEEQWRETFYMGVGLSYVLTCLFMWFKLRSEILPHLLFFKVLDFLFCSSKFPSLTTGVALLTSLFYSVRLFKRSALKILAILGIISILSYSYNFVTQNPVVSELSLQKYTSVCPSDFECSRLEGLTVNWTALEVISVRQKSIRHPLNEILVLIHHTELLHDLNVNYCDLALIQRESSDKVWPINDKDESDEGIFSFNFGAPEGEEGLKKELQRITIRARIWKTEICRNIEQGSIVNVLGRTSSLTSDVDVISL